MESSFIVTPERQSQGTTVCTYADWQSRFATASIAFCYRERFDVQRLRDALAHVLGDFPEYVGRLTMDGSTLRIEHGKLGAVFELVSSAEPFASLMATAQRGKDRVVCPPMSTRRTLKGRDPLLAVRLTETSDGTVLGVTWHHSVGDLASTMHLLHAWSKAYGNAAHEVPPQILDRAQFLADRMPDPPSATEALRIWSVGEIFSLAPFLLQRKRRTDFAFGWDELAQIQEWATRTGFVSSCDALCAHAFSVLRTLSPQRPVRRLALAVNYRKRVGLPANLLGNLISTITVSAEPEIDAVTIASALRAKLASYASQHADYHATHRFLDEHKGHFERMRTVPKLVDPSGGTWIVSNVTNSGTYELDFGGALPALWSPTLDAPLPLMATLFDSPERSGITLSMHLPEVLADRITSPEGQALLHTHQAAART